MLSGVHELIQFVFILLSKHRFLGFVVLLAASLLRNIFSLFDNFSSI
jgi:hypothetical protein